MKANSSALITVMMLLSALLSPDSRATTWGDAELTDPLTGEKVASQQILSYGSYIYDWPSKFDVVFWPLTAEEFICINPKNGYASFNDDFEEVPEDQREGLRKWLAEKF